MSGKVTITIKEHEGGLSMDLHVPAHMRGSIAATMATVMLETAKQMGDEFASEHGLPKSTVRSGMSPTNPFK